MTKFYSILLLYLILQYPLSAQKITQTIVGTVIDKESNSPIDGASVMVLRDSTVLQGAITDAQGNFRLEKIPVGRVDISASYLGYKRFFSPNVFITSAKEMVMTIELESSVVTKQEVVISGTKRGETINEMALLSVRTFSPEETNRYAGSRGDPALMARNYAGVTGTDDSQNALVVRGNSPFGVMYRIDDIGISNPNHFAGEGQTGASVAILNNRMLTNSDFYTGAFPAEFGDAVAGVFDIRLKNGNSDEQEFTAQIGALGAEVFGEGPLGTNTNASYIFNYRYATLEALVKLGINIGTTAIPKYQDFQFKMNFPLKSGDDLSFFGIGGYSGINFITSNELKPTPSTDIYETPNTNELFHAGVGMFGMTYIHRVSDNEYSKVSIGVSTNYSDDDETRIIRHVNPATGDYVIDTMYHYEDYKFSNVRYTVSFMRNKKINTRSSIRYGVLTEMFQPEYFYRILLEPAYIQGLSNYQWDTTLNTPHDEFHFLFQPYFQWKYAVTEKLSMVFGLHGQYFTLSNSWSLEPRFSLKWQFKPNQSLSFGTGLYSQLQPLYQYFAMDTNGVQNNRHMNFSRSYHAVTGYDIFFKKDIHIKLEAYFQYLWGLPVDTFKSSYNMMDEGTGFDLFFPGKMQNTGLGRNMGIELTLEKFFTHNWFIMFTGSVYDSRLTGSDGLWWNSDYNGIYVFHLLGTKEFRWSGKKRLNTIAIGGAITFAGGQRYTQFDTTLSKESVQPVVIDSLRDKKQFSPYFRFDLKLSYSANSKRFTHEVGIDLVNVTNYQNILRVQYISPQQPDQIYYQLGFLPLFYYRLDFGLGKHRQ